jgi:DNA-binding MarR family transcriptional regulator
VEIFQNGSTTPTAESGASEEQVTFVVHGFVQVWNKFEEAIAHDLSARRGLRRPADESRFGADNDLLFRVGTTLNAASSLTMGELSSALFVPLSTATRVVNTLVERGYVQRFPDPEDRRVVHVRFTPKGRRLYKFVDGRIADHVRMISAYLTKDEMATLVKLLSKVAVAVKETLK